MEPKWLKYFVLSAGGILLAAAIVRFLIAAGGAQVISVSEPLLGLPLLYAVLAAGVMELAVALVCLFGKVRWLQIGGLAWISVIFICYNIALFCQHLVPQGACWGTLTDPLHLSRGMTGVVMSLLPYCLTLGSCAVAVWYWRHGGFSQTTLKMFCPSCGGKIRFFIWNLGRKIPCPLCKTTLTLRAPENLKMACHFCHDNIEFPAHALGQKIPCPHCNMTVILKEPA